MQARSAEVVNEAKGGDSDAKSEMQGAQARSDNYLVLGIAFICQEVLYLNMAGTYVRRSQGSNPRPPDQTTEALTTELCR